MGESLIPVQASTYSRAYTTGLMRFKRDPVTGVSVLQQEWAVDWANNLVRGTTKDWFDVPEVTE